MTGARRRLAAYAAAVAAVCVIALVASYGDSDPSGNSDGSYGNWLWRYGIGVACVGRSASELCLCRGDGGRGAAMLQKTDAKSLPVSKTASAETLGRAR